jgi:hypothetical protein
MRELVDDGNRHYVLLANCLQEQLSCDYAAFIVKLEVLEIDDIAVAERIA